MEQQKPIMQENKTRLWIYFAIGLGILLILGAIIYFAFIKDILISKENQTGINSGKTLGSSEVPSSNSTQNGEPISQSNARNASPADNYKNWTEKDYLS